MKDRQVEVVPGSHAVARVAGAVIVVAHRGPGRPTAEDTAAVALESLAELVRAAAEDQPGGPGSVIAREATRWLMKYAEQISPGVPIDFGVLSAADNGGVAIFLHGAVTAVLAGDGANEYYRGSDAAFTVDRVASEPAKAVALFVDDAKGRIPDLPPERGLGWLVEGIAQAGGAVVWSNGARSRVRTAEPAGEVRRPPPPTARIDREPRPPQADSRPAEQPATGMQPATSMLDATGNATGPGHPAVTPHDPHNAETRAGGTNPAPEPDPDLQRRLEATARATVLTVKVMGFKCARAHPSDPRSAFCTVCGMPVDQTQALSEVVRPPLGMLVLDDGMTYLLAADAVIGRDPEHSEAAQRGLVPLRVDDTSGGMSRAHAEVHLVNWDVQLIDRGSTNGTRTRLPGYRDWVRLTPNQPMVLIPGTEVMIGNRVLRYEPAAPPPFG
ncbi:FHA domain-containing protein [Nocardia neocaledoniensis]|uniref:FHA domain-containing protein n=1 Tax=Nocardia neocaledoniensis TaxID=236511 RepID=UPI002455E1DE|nr:FHA domain-containing protein [Nocardia neocaledoniensis]